MSLPFRTKVLYRKNNVYSPLLIILMAFSYNSRLIQVLLNITFSVKMCAVTLVLILKQITTAWSHLFVYLFFVQPTKANPNFFFRLTELLIFFCEDDALRDLPVVQNYHYKSPASHSFAEVVKQRCFFTFIKSQFNWYLAANPKTPHKIICMNPNVYFYVVNMNVSLSCHVAVWILINIRIFKRLT